MTQHHFQQSIEINATPEQVERCFTDHGMMHRWLNPALRCDPVGESWQVTVGAKSRFVLNIPVLEPCLMNEVVVREPQTIVWRFSGFFVGTDRWQWHSLGDDRTYLDNTFTCTIPNPFVSFGFRTIAAAWTRRDMRQQLQRLKQVAEGLTRANGDTSP